MDEHLLTPNEIDDILRESKEPNWADSNMMGIGSRKTSIVRVLADEGLIMIKGNEFTGMDHITQRHRFNRQVWRNDKEKLEETSELRYGIAPYDYLLIAKSVYKPENLRPDLNKKPKEFDFYFGPHRQLNGDVVEYRLVTYKGTGIVHTLHPNKSDNRRKRLLKYRQCGIGQEYSPMDASFTYEVRYRDKAEREVFRLIIRGIRGYPYERWYIRIGEGNDVYPQTVFVKELVFHSSAEHGFMRSLIISDGDKYEFEQIALQILEGKFNYDKKEELHALEGRIDQTEPTYFKW